MKKKNLVEETKNEIANNILNSQTLKYTKYALFAVGAVYGLGLVFKILAFTNKNLNDLKSTLNHKL